LRRRSCQSEAHSLKRCLFAVGAATISSDGPIALNDADAHFDLTRVTNSA
jgi:hypothetical protein